MKLLLHSCCAPCSTVIIEALNEEVSKPSLFWYNPNIHPYTEYKSRYDSLRAFAHDEKLDLIIEDEYGLRKFIDTLYSEEKTRDSEIKRCHLCYQARLEKTALQAAEKGYNTFSTSLLASPYQKHDLIRHIGEECANKYGVDFFYRDFRPWFREGQKKARENGSYMQKYCGCIFSEEERYLNVLR